MARTIVGAKRGDLHRIHPNDIVVNLAENVSRFGMQNQAIKAIKNSFVAQGQLQPVSIYVNEENQAVLLAGFHRYTAAKQLCEENPDTPFILDCVVESKMNDAEKRELANIAENHVTALLSPMDYAKQVKRLGEIYGKTDKEVAGIYGFTQGWVSQTRGLNRLVTAIQEALHKGKITLSQGIALSALSEEKQTKAFEKIVASTGKTKGKDVADAIRATGKRVARTAKEVKELLEKHSANPAYNLLLDFWTGVIDEESFDEKFEGLENGVEEVVVGEELEVVV